MKYKVGDKVRVRSDLKCEEYYDGVPFTSEMNRFKGMEFTIARVNNGGYYEVLETLYNFTNEMLEPVEELTAEEAIRILGGMCRDFSCCECPIYELIEDEGSCDNLRAEKPDEVIEVLKQWKADHKKNPLKPTKT